MPLFTKTEMTGQDLLAQYSLAAEAFQAESERIAAEAADRETVVEARLKELEAEKLVLNQLGLVGQIVAASEPTNDPVLDHVHLDGGDL